LLFSGVFFPEGVGRMPLFCGWRGEIWTLFTRVKTPESVTGFVEGVSRGTATGVLRNALITSL